MEGTGAGWDSCLYRAFIVGGILAVITGVVVSVIVTPDDSQIPVRIGVGGMALFMAVLIGYWAYQIVIKGYGSPKVADPNLSADVNDLSVLQSWNSLFVAMTIHGGDLEEMKKMEKQGRAGLATWYGWASVIGLGPIILMVPFAFGWLDWSVIRYGVVAYLGLVVLMALFTGPLMSRALQANQVIHLAPLGLEQTATPGVGLIPGVGGPRPRVEGASVLEGKRFGRAVRIELNGWSVTTYVQAPSPSFEIQSEGGKLRADRGAPQFVNSALKGLRKAKRWAGLEVRGGPDGITAVRPGKGVNMWLYDLWLIERIVGELEAGRSV